MKKQKEKKFGRKKDGDDSGKHKKNSEDNIIFKIKSNYNNWLLNLINKFIEKYSPNSEKLKKIDFQNFSKIINQEKNISFLNMKLCEIFSQNISLIYSKLINENGGKDHNKKIIERIMKSEDEKLKIVKELLKITYKDGLDIYRFKENETNLSKTLIDEIINLMEGRVDKFLKDTYKNEIKKNQNNEAAYDFVSSLLIMVYNYERWFLMKTPRKKKENKTEE